MFPESEGAEPKAAGRATHKDIARLAGTSTATVSHVLNNRGAEQRISEKTRDVVLRAARSLGYVPDLNARRLRHRLGASASPAFVLAVLRPVGSTLGMAAAIIDAASASLRAMPGTPQLVLEEYVPGHLAEHPGLLAGSRFHGAIVSGLTPADETFLEDSTLLVPIVAFQRRLRGRAYVDVDNIAGGAAVTHHLLASGRRRIAALTYTQPHSRAQQDRLEGYQAALACARDHGTAIEAHIVFAPSPDAQDGAEATRCLLADWRPDALFAPIDSLAFGALHALARAGLRVPEDVAVVGYDDTAYAPVAHPPLSSVRKPDAEMVGAAVEWLASATRGGVDAPLQRVYQPHLIIRESSAAR